MKNNENAYDSASKRILSKKDILSNLMKECIPEYKNLSWQEIMKCIEDGSEEEYIKGLNCESINDEEETVRFDILFTSRLPNSNEQIGMYIDVEPQNRVNPGYNLLNRALYYASRLIDQQKGRTFNFEDYDKLRKVYSIWICTNPRIEQRDSINYYSFNEECIKGDYKTNIDYKKLNIIMLYIGDNYNYDLTGPLEMLSLIFKNTGLKPHDVTRKLNDGYGIMMKESEVSSMSDLSVGLIEQGMQEGMIQAIVNFIKSGIPQDEAFKITKADENIKQAVLEKLKEE